MKISEAKWEDGNLVLRTMDAEARRFAYSFKSGEYEIKPTRKRRSLSANAYCWVLCDAIAKATGLTKLEVYRKNISESGFFTPLPVRADAVEDWKRIWSHGRLGWISEVVDDSKIPGYKLVFAYRGSSDYDTKEMSVFLDNLVQDAKAVGVETMPPDELERLIGDWHAQDD